LIVGSDAAARSIRSAARVREIAEAVKLDIKEKYLIVTKVTGNELELLQPEIEKTGLDFLGTIPLDPMIAEYDVRGQALLELPDDAPSVQAANAILQKLAL